VTATKEMIEVEKKYISSQKVKGRFPIKAFVAATGQSSCQANFNNIFTLPVG
jgi:hypothetical protein